MIYACIFHLVFSWLILFSQGLKEKWFWVAKYGLDWVTGEPWKEKETHHWYSAVLLSQCQALTSNSSRPHSCLAICSDDQSHTHTCCKFHSALTWHSCRRKGGISVAAPAHYHDFSVTQTQGDTAAEILVIVSKPSASGGLYLPNLSVTAGPQSQTLQNSPFSAPRDF